MAVYAVVPAAGLSRRMGAAKLLLPVAGRPVLTCVLEELLRAAVDLTVVATAPDADELRRLIRQPAVSLTLPHQTESMRDTVQCAVDWLSKHHAPMEADAVLLALADQPTIRAESVDALIAAHRRQSGKIRVPTHAGRRGHPVLFPWPLISHMHDLPPDVGLNHLLKTHPQFVEESPLPFADIHDDLDTPDDYRRLVERS